MKSIVESRNKEERTSFGSQQKLYALIIAGMFLVIISAELASAIPTPTSFFTWNNNSFADSLGNHNGTSYRTTNITGKIVDGRNFDGASSEINLTGYVQPATAASWSIWVYLNASSGFNGIMGSSDGSGLKLYALVRHTNGSMCIYSGGYNCLNEPSINTWHLYVISRTTANLTVVWYDNTIITNRTISGSSIPSAAETFKFGNIAAIGVLNGSLDAAGIWDGQVLNQSDETVLWNGGVGIEYPFSTTSYFQITARDNLTSGSLTTFNATVNGTFYTTTNGTIVTSINQSSTSFLVNITVNASNYLNYAYSNWNTTSNHQANLTPYANITAKDVYDNSSLSGFTIEYNGTNYTASGTTASIPASDLTYNFTLYNTSYITRQYISVPRNATFNASVYQAIATFNASEIISGLNIANFTVNASSIGSNNTASYPALYFKAGTYQVTFSKGGWYSNTQNFTVAALTNYTYNFSNIYSVLLNVSARNISSGSNINSFTARIVSANYSYNTTTYTTNGTLLTPWVNDTNLNVSINSTGIANASVLWNTSNYTGRPVIVNISLSAYQANTINFIFLDEINLSLITSVNITAFLTGTISSYNFTTPNGTYSISLINPDTYAVTYMGLGYNQRNYFYTVVNLTATNLTLYLRPTSNSSIVLINIVDQNQRSLVGATVYSRVKNLSSNSYYIVEMCQTDINGQCQISADVSTTTYKATTTYNFLIYYAGVVIGTSGDTVLSGNSLPLQANTGSNPLVNDFALAGLRYGNIVYNNVTSAYTVTYSDPATIITSFCLTAYRRIGSTTTAMNSSCSALTANTLTIGANTSLGDENYAQATAVYNTNTYLLTTGTAQTSNTTGANYRPIFLVFVFIGVLITIFLGTKSLATTGIVLLAGITFALIRVSGNILPIVAVTGLIGMAVIIYMRLKE